jgi:hypothetical protein
MKAGYHYEIWQDGIRVAAGSGDVLEDVRRDMVHYASQYIQDGPIDLRGHPDVIRVVALGMTAN